MTTIYRAMFTIQGVKWPEFVLETYSEWLEMKKRPQPQIRGYGILPAPMTLPDQPGGQRLGPHLPTLEKT